MKIKQWRFLLALFVLIAATLACGESENGDQLVRTLAAPTADITTQESQMSPTPLPTPTPEPSSTPTPEIEGLVPEGTSLVGTDIEPGIYVGLAGESFFESCYWERLSDLSGNFDAIIANDNAEGQFYIEVLETDRALTTDCELLPIDAVAVPEQPFTEIRPGMYLIGRDIEPGTWRGQADENETCYWERLSCVLGSFDCILANDNAEGQFFVEVSANDFAFYVDCDMQKVE